MGKKSCSDCGINEELSARKVMRRMHEDVSDEEYVCVKNGRSVKGGGIVLATASDRDKGILTACPNFGEAGPKVEKPRALVPRVVVYDVPKELTDKDLMITIHEKSVKDLISLNEFRKRSAVFQRSGVSDNGRVSISRFGHVFASSSAPGGLQQLPG